MSRAWRVNTLCECMLMPLRTYMFLSVQAAAITEIRLSTVKVPGCRIYCDGSRLKISFCP